MEQPNWWLILVVAFIPLVIGSIYYHPSVFGKSWMRTSEISEERAQSGNKIKIFGLAYLFCVLGAYILCMNSVHQNSVFQLFFGDPAMADASSSVSTFLSNFMDTYGDRHRSFGHGVIHGMEFALFVGLTLIGTHALFERRPFKYTMIHLGFWILNFGIMGGLLCAYF